MIVIICLLIGKYFNILNGWYAIQCENNPWITRVIISAAQAYNDGDDKLHGMEAQQHREESIEQQLADRLKTVEDKFADMKTSHDKLEESFANLQEQCVNVSHEN